MRAQNWFSHEKHSTFSLHHYAMNLARAIELVSVARNKTCIE